MNRLLLSILLASPALLAQGWGQFSSTTIKVGSNLSVCPPDHFNSTVSGWPDLLWYSEDLDHRSCDEHLTGLYNGGVYDSAKKRWLTWGGGHNGNQDNSWYALDFDKISHSTATCGGRTCQVHSNGGAAGDTITPGQAVLSRLNDPGKPDFTCPPPNPTIEGASVSLQSYGGLVKLPRTNEVFVHGSANFCASGDQALVWTVDLAKLGITSGEWTQRASWSAGSINSAGLQCFLDTSYTDEDVVGCVAKGNTFARWHRNTNAWDAGIFFNVQMSAGNGATMVVDPKRKVVFSIGPDAAYGNNAIFVFPLSNPAANVNITSQTSGCADLIDFPGPGARYDPTIDRIVGYVPQSASNRTVAANHVVIFDPATYTCVDQPQLGTGPTASLLVNTTAGVYGHWDYISDMGLYVAFVDGTTNVYYFKLNATPTAGLGSSTLTCLDRDGDGYGVGPGCTGPDADDLDAAVHTSTQFVTRWTTLKRGLAHLGYAPSNFWYIATAGGSPAGSDSNACHDTDGSTAAGTPCATWSHIQSSVACGDVLILYGGDYTFRVDKPTCTTGSPFIVMGYPGQLPTFTTSGSGVSGLGAKFLVVDGIKFNGNNTSGGSVTSLGSTGFPLSLSSTGNFVLRHIEGMGNRQGQDIETGGTYVIEDSVFHDQIEQHGIYTANHDAYDGGTCPSCVSVSANDAKDELFRRLILYNNPLNGFHANGHHSNLVLEDTIAYQNDIAGVSWQNGVNHSILRNLLAFNNSSEAFEEDNYPGWCSTYDTAHTCPYDQNYNTFENITCYETGKTISGVDVQQPCLLFTYAPGTTTGDLGNQTIRNVAGVGYHDPSGGNAVIAFQKMAHSSTSKISHVRLYNSEPTVHSSQVISVNDGTGGPYYTCAQAQTASGTVFSSVDNCSFGNPGFVAASNAYWSNPALYNLNPDSGSALIGSGTGGLSHDVVGYPRNSSANTIGAYEYQGAAPCSITPSSLGPYTAGQAVSNTLVPANCSTSTCSVTSGTLTGSGLSLGGTQNCVLSGTAVAGSFTATVGYDTASNPYSVTINVAPSVTSSSLTAGTQGTPYDQTVATTGGTGAVTCAGSGAPSGLTIGSNCHVTGTPTTPGSYTMSVTPTDANFISGSAHNVSLAISPGGAPSGMTVTGSFTGTIRE